MMIDSLGHVVNATNEVIEMMNYCNKGSCRACSYTDWCDYFKKKYNTVPYLFKPYTEEK